MPEFIVVLLEPKHEGNVGAVARCMKNFGFYNLFLINSCELGEVCYQRAKHAKEVVDNAKKFNSFEEVIREVDFLVGTSGIVNITDKHHIRNPITPREFLKFSKKLDSTVGLLFGRENYGLYDSELLKCDLLVTIPTNSEYPIMNLSHAVAVLLYELSSADLKFEIKGHRKATDFEKEKLFEQFKLFLESMDYPKHKRKNTEILFRRLLGRATPSKWEFYTLMGVFGRASKLIGGSKKSSKKRIKNK